MLDQDRTFRQGQRNRPTVGLMPMVAAVTAADAEVLHENPRRAGLVVTNLTGGVVSFAFDGAPAVLNSGITLQINGSFQFTEWLFSFGHMHAIAAVPGNIAIQEFQ